MKIKDEAVAGIVAGAAFVASAEHIIHVVTTTGGSTYTGWTYPLGIDGLVYVGIMAARRGRRTAGLAAIAIGAAYSLAFNGDALGAFQLPRLLIAASMPICMLAAFVIVHSGRHAAEEAAEVAEDVVEDVDAVAVVYDANGTYRAPISDVCAEDAAEQIVRDAARPSRPSAGRAPAWDVVEAVRLLDAEPDASNEVVAEKVGTSGKSVQRLKRIIARIKDGMADEDIVAAMGPGNASLSLVSTVRAAVAA